MMLLYMNYTSLSSLYTKIPKKRRALGLRREQKFWDNCPRAWPPWATVGRAEGTLEVCDHELNMRSFHTSKQCCSATFAYVLRNRCTGGREFYLSKFEAFAENLWRKSWRDGLGDTGCEETLNTYKSNQQQWRQGLNGGCPLRRDAQHLQRCLLCTSST